MDSGSGLRGAFQLAGRKFEHWGELWHRYGDCEVDKPRDADLRGALPREHPRGDLRLQLKDWRWSY
eukprot:1281849-Pyramimonas_sp.AAC.1